jgi:hypothetical protein
MDAHMDRNKFSLIKWFKNLGKKSPIEHKDPIMPSNVIYSNISPTWTTGTTMTTTSSPSILYPTTGVTYTVGNGYSTVIGQAGMYSAPNPAPVFQLSGNQGEIVRMNRDGSIVWSSEININEAAEAFAKSMYLGAEIQSGITKNAKLRMRDSVFEDLITIAKEKGSLSADDLTYLLEASKIVEKLKGEKE